MKKYMKFLLLVIVNILIFIAIGALITSGAKHIQTNVILNDFISKGVYQEDKSNNLIKYYLVPGNEKDQTVDFSTRLPGVKGDILVSTEANVGIPIASSLVSYFAGGHAALSTGTYQDYQIRTTATSTIEATGMDFDNNDAIVTTKSSSWVEDNYFNSIMGLRVNMTEEERDEVLSLATSLIGDPYNYSFFFNTDKTSYCSDLITKCFKRIGVNLNKDGGTNSIYDLIVTDDTYLFYYHYFDEFHVKHVYYLGWEE